MVITTLLGYLILAGFFVIEPRRRAEGEAKSLEAGKFDQRTTRLLIQAYFVSVLALLAAWLLNFRHLGNLPNWIGWPGVFLGLCGVLMRLWVMQFLGTSYTRTLKITEEQVLIRDGPYRWVRHAGYLGTILMWTGVALATANWIVVLIVLIVTCAAYHYRIQNEEQMLLTKIPDYAEYRSKTWRLFPLIY